MNIRICHHETQGLINDAVILRQVVVRKHPSAVVEVVCYPEQSLYSTSNVTPPPTDVQLFLEHIHPVYLNSSSRNIFIPNPEFMNQIDARHAQSDQVSKIVAKTQSGFRALCGAFGTKVCFWGWTSIDRLDETVWKTYDECIHVKGCSPYKNSQMVVNLWVQHPEWPMLHLVTYGNPERNGYLELNKEYINVTDNIRLYQRKVDEAALTRLMNRSGIHICPSRMEGFGHYVNEARSCGSYVITTDGEPMNELVSRHTGCLVEVDESIKHCLANRHVIDQKKLENAINQTFAKSHDELMLVANNARARYVEDTFTFEQNVALD
jgi:hypothetical protein